VRELKQAGVLAAVSSIPQKAERFAGHRAGGGRRRFPGAVHRLHRAPRFNQYKSLDLAALTKGLKIPV